MGFGGRLQGYKKAKARYYIKALTPWIKDDQIEYVPEMNPVGVFGAHTPFPPFHWKCGTTTMFLM
jgi:hypothetical protein